MKSIGARFTDQERNAEVALIKASQGTGPFILDEFDLDLRPGELREPHRQLAFDLRVPVPRAACRVPRRTMRGPSLLAAPRAGGRNCSAGMSPWTRRAEIFQIRWLVFRE